MDDGIEKLNTEVVENKVSKIIIEDARGEKVDAIQEGEFRKRLENDRVEEKLIQFETFVGDYTKQKVSEGLKVNLVDGPFGDGEVVNGVLFVNLPNSSEILAESNDSNAEGFLKVLTEAGTTYKEIAMISASSTTLHETSHMIIDSRPGSQLAIDFENAQPEGQKIILDEDGHTLSLLDEGITYAFQLEKDSENELIQRLESKKPQGNESFTIKTRKQLGEALRVKVKEYLNGEKGVIKMDNAFLVFAGEEMKKLDIEKYKEEAEKERRDRREKIDNTSPV